MMSKQGFFFEVDQLAEIIRSVDDNHSLGAGALAEAIIEKLQASQPNELKRLELECASARAMGYSDILDALNDLERLKAQQGSVAGATKLYECSECGHLYQAPVSRCDCMPVTQKFKTWLAWPESAGAPQPDVQGDSVPSWKHEALIAHSKQQDRIIAEMRDRLHTVSLYEQREVWFWQGDGEDYPESLSCPVVIKADDLRKILQASPQPAEQQPSADDSLTPVPDELFAAEFSAWWEQHGQFCRSGGGEYERTFAFEAWRHLYPKLMKLQKVAAEHQPAPDVDVLVEALQAISRNELDAQRAQHVAAVALAAHRKQGGGQ